MNFDVYCDECRPDLLSSQHPAARYMVIGSLWLRTVDRAAFKAAIHELRDQHHVGGEFKWQKVSPSRAIKRVRMIFLASPRRSVRFWHGMPSSPVHAWRCWPSPEATADAPATFRLGSSIPCLRRGAAESQPPNVAGGDNHCAPVTHARCPGLSFCSLLTGTRPYPALAQPAAD